MSGKVSWVEASIISNVGIFKISLYNPNYFLRYNNVNDLIL